MAGSYNATVYVNSVFRPIAWFLVSFGFVRFVWCYEGCVGVVCLVIGAWAGRSAGGVVEALTHPPVR